MESNTRNHLATPVRGPSAKCHVSKVPAESIGAGRSIGTEVEWNVDGIQVETHQLCSHHQLTGLVLFFLSSQILATLLLVGSRNRPIAQESDHPEHTWSSLFGPVCRCKTDPKHFIRCSRGTRDETTG